MRGADNNTRVTLTRQLFEAEAVAAKNKGGRGGASSNAAPVSGGVAMAQAMQKGGGSKAKTEADGNTILGDDDCCIFGRSGNGKDKDSKEVAFLLK